MNNISLTTETYIYCNTVYKNYKKNSTVGDKNARYTHTPPTCIVGCLILRSTNFLLSFKPNHRYPGLDCLIITSVITIWHIRETESVMLMLFSLYAFITTLCREEYKLPHASSFSLLTIFLQSHSFRSIV